VEEAGPNLLLQLASVDRKHILSEIQKTETIDNLNRATGLFRSAHQKTDAVVDQGLRPRGETMRQRMSANGLDSLLMDTTVSPFPTHA